jgi:tetratricopeptide (TPR) repeat protein
VLAFPASPAAPQTPLGKRHAAKETKSACHGRELFICEVPPVPKEEPGEPFSSQGRTPVDWEHALAWARAERASLFACLDHAAGTGQHARVTALTAGLATLLRRDGPWAEAITRHTTAIQAARHFGDQPGQANALNDLGVVRRLTGDYPGAAQALEQALDIYRDLGNRGGWAEVLNEAGTLHRVSGKLAQAEECHQQALELARAIAGSWDEAHALAGLGRCALASGRTAEPTGRLRHALEVFRRIGAAEAVGVSAELEALTDARPGAQGS